MFNISFSSPFSAIIIGGLTGTGKSSFALSVAQALSGGIINADSLQLYKDLPILSALPSKEDLENISHFLYACLSYKDRWSVADWQIQALSIANSLIKKQILPIFVGGTGFYLESLLKGISPIPPVPISIRAHIQSLLKEKGLPFLFSQLQEIDEATTKKISSQDTQRITRALEVWHATHKSLSDWQKIEPSSSTLTISSFYKILICPSLKELTPMLENRVQEMLKVGAIQEVEKVLALNLSPEHPLRKTIGFQEIASYLKEEISYSDLIAVMTLKTRQYAKRQSTWFRNRFKADLYIEEVYSPKDFSSLLEKIQEDFTR